MLQIERKFVDEMIAHSREAMPDECCGGLNGYQPQAAIDFIREVRPGTIETTAQQAAVHDYSKFLKDQERERRRKAIEALDDP